MAALEPGSRAPSFKLKRDGGGTLSLAEFKGRNLVIYFYPKADTPGCTRESIEFSKLKAQFAKAKTDVIGISADPVEAQDRFKKKHRIDLPLGSDPEHDMLTAYGMGREIALRAEVHGRDPEDLPDRRQGPHRSYLAESPRRRTRRGRIGGCQSPLARTAPH